MPDNWGRPDEDGWERGSLEFAFYHSLVDDDPKHAAPVLEALGRISATWSRMEHHLDALIIQINKPDYSDRLYAAEHPVSFSRKIDLLRKWFNQYPPLAPYKPDMAWLTSRLVFLSKEDGEVALSRNVLLHAIPAKFDASTQTLTLHHLKFVGTNIHSRHITLTMDQLAAFAKLVQDCNRFLSSITQELFTPAGHELLRKGG